MMKVKELVDLISPYQDYEVMSDSGWEVFATDINGVHISHKHKLIVFTQNYEDGVYVPELGGIYSENFEELRK